MTQSQANQQTNFQTSGYIQTQQCPTCGVCPTCGRKSYQTYPYYPGYPYTSPNWTGGVQTVTGMDPNQIVY